MANNGKGRVPWHTDEPTPELNSMEVIIDWLTTDQLVPWSSWMMMMAEEMN